MANNFVIRNFIESTVKFTKRYECQNATLICVTRWVIRTDLNLNNDSIAYSSSRCIDAKEPIGSKLLFLSPIRSRKGAYQLKTSLAIDSDIKR